MGVNLIDESEPWALFNRDKEHIIKEFDHKYYSTEIDDMFLQYDLVYPSGSAAESSVKIHAAQIEPKDFSQENLPSIQWYVNLYASGALVEKESALYTLPMATRKSGLCYTMMGLYLLLKAEVNVWLALEGYILWKYEHVYGWCADYYKYRRVLVMR